MNSYLCSVGLDSLGEDVGAGVDESRLESCFCDGHFFSSPCLYYSLVLRISCGENIPVSLLRCTCQVLMLIVERCAKHEAQILGIIMDKFNIQIRSDSNKISITAKRE